MQYAVFELSLMIQAADQSSARPRPLSLRAFVFATVESTSTVPVLENRRRTAPDEWTTMLRSRQHENSRALAWTACCSKPKEGNGYSCL